MKKTIAWWWCGIYGFFAASKTKPLWQTITRDEKGNDIAITLTDEDHKIVKVFWQKSGA